MNTVIGGEYKNSILNYTFTGKVYIHYTKLFQKGKKIMLNSDTVAEYTIIDSDERTKIGSGLVRSAVGGAMFGVAGAMVGAASAKKKKSYIVDVRFHDGTHSTLEMDNNFFKLFLGSM